MKKTAFITLAAAALLVGCVSRPTTPVVQTPAQSSAIRTPAPTTTIVNGQVVQQQQSSPNQMNVKAICRDGSYALELNEQTCLGHGGIAVSTDVYREEHLSN